MFSRRPCLEIEAPPEWLALALARLDALRPRPDPGAAWYARWLLGAIELDAIPAPGVEPWDPGGVRLLWSGSGRDLAVLIAQPHEVRWVIRRARYPEVYGARGRWCVNALRDCLRWLYRERRLYEGEME